MIYSININMNSGRNIYLVVIDQLDKLNFESMDQEKVTLGMLFDLKKSI